ncbi:MAG: hypothetical protein ACREBS_10850 [Nitrososphaerales archaeon]
MNKEETVHFTITVPKSLKKEMSEFQEINWSGVATRAFRKQIEAQTIIRQFAEKGISDEEAIRRGLSLRHEKQLESPNLRKTR